jgi:hypothetical protein
MSIFFIIKVKEREANMMHLRGCRIQIILVTAIFLLAWGAAWGNESLRYADLGDFRLENRAIIRECRLAYRILGKINSQKSNTILIPTWLAGTTQDLVDLGIVGPGKVIDSSRYYVIAVDSFGNGVSSSPSNSAVQPDRAFPQFSIKGYGQGSACASDPASEYAPHSRGNRPIDGRHAGVPVDGFVS